MKGIGYSRRELIKKIVVRQLQEYSKTGKRLFTSTEATIETCYKAGSRKTFSEQAISLLLEIMSPIKRSSLKAKIIYDIIFGQAMTSYHDIKKRCIKARFQLMTNPTEWFIKLKNNVENIPVAHLRVKIRCRECNHSTYKQITRIGQKRRGCYECNLKNLNKPLNYEDSLKLSEARKLELLSNEIEFHDAITDSQKRTLRKNGRSDHAILKWRCLVCDREFYNSYCNIRDGSSCPTCSLGKEQKLTHLLCEYIFKDYIKSEKFFIANKPMIEIFSINNLTKNLRHGNVHVDSYAVLQIGEREINLAVEYNGQQHEDSSDGWEAYQRISKFKGIYDDWKDLINRDKAKVRKFKKFNYKNYYLIVIPHKVRPRSRFNYIISEFKRQSGIKLDKNENIDWRKLFYKK